MKTVLAICCLALVFGNSPALGLTLSGRVFRVTGGDELTIIDTANALHTVRLAGIRAPGPDQTFGRDARTHLRALLLGRFAIVHYRHRDPVRRIIGKVTYGGADVNLRQIQAGLARFHEGHGLEAGDRRRYRQAEEQARGAGLGIWQASDARGQAHRPR